MYNTYTMIQYRLFISISIIKHLAEVELVGMSSYNVSSRVESVCLCAGRVALLAQFISESREA